MDETSDVAHDGLYEAKQVLCLGCDARERKQAGMRDQDTYGIRLAVVRIEDVET